MADWMTPKPVPTPAILKPATSYVQAQPKGVVLVLGAWNYPYNVTIGPAISALAAGNCIVVKPSELAPESANVMKRIFGQLDQNGVRCLTGDAELSSALTKQPFDHIIFTGNPRVAKLVLAAAAPNLTPVTCELGGKSPVIIAKGTNLKEACRRITFHKFTNTGQTCIAPDYLLVERSVKDEVCSLLTENVQTVFGGSPETAEHFGRLVHAGAAERLWSAMQEDHRGKVLVGGEKVVSTVKEGHRYVPPTIVIDPQPGCKLLEEEIFGPILVVLTVDSYDEAITYVNARPKPLSLYIFAPQKVTKKVIESTSSGGVVVGDCIVHKGNPDLPFGGVGNSGMGKLHGYFGFRELSNERAVMVRPLFPPSPLALPINSHISRAGWLYATCRPGKFLRKQVWKLFLILLAFLFVRRWRRS